MKVWKVTILILFLILIAVSQTDVKKVQANPGFVTETASSITIENSYYKAVIDKTSGSFGGIKDFYIKPNTSVDLVASNTNYDVLGGHEWGDYNTSLFYNQFSGDVLNTQISVLAQTSTYVIIYAKFDVGNATYSMTVEEWKTFYLNYPYFQVNWKRTWNDPANDVHDDQICFLFENDWVEQVVMLNGSGQVETKTQQAVGILREVFNPLASMEIASSYSWVAYYNSTYGDYFGTIFTDMHPRWNQIEMWYDIHGEDQANSYSEYQIGIDTIVHARYGGEESYGSYINYVTDDYTDISSLASSLYSTTYTNETVDSFWTTAENSKSAGKLQGNLMSGWYKGTLDNSPFVLVFRTGWEDNDAKTVKISPSYVNSTSGYNLIDISEVTVYQEYNSTTEANITYSYTFDNRILVNTTFQSYNDTEIVVVKGYFKMLTDVNLKELKWTVGTGSGRTAMNNSVITVDNTTETHAYVGYAAMNLTNWVPRWGQTIDFFHIYSNATENLIPSGTEYNMEYYFMPFRKRLTDGIFVLNDFLQLHESTLKTYRNYWDNLYDASGMRIKDLYNDQTNLVYHHLDEDTLTLVIYGDSGSTVTTEIYVGNKGEPETISGASSWTYDSSSKIVTLITQHSSVKDVEVDWTPPTIASGSYFLSVSVSQGNLPLFNIPITIQNTTKYTDLSGKAVFELPYGYYNVTATWKGDSKSVWVWLNRDKQVGIQFSVSSRPHNEWVLFLPVAVLLVILLIRKGKLLRG